MPRAAGRSSARDRVTVRSPSEGARADRWHHEKTARESGFVMIAGVDEVGRGPLAGPVVAACVILPKDFDESGVDDSKKLTEKQRDQAEIRIKSLAFAYAIASVEPLEIDRINILKASQKAMRLAIHAMSVLPDFLLIDGLPVPDLPCPNQSAIVKGDSLSVSIAAASILAKVYRDNLMREYHVQYPVYGFDGHKGYASKDHLEALYKHGPCPIHRRSFSPMNSLFFGIEDAAG